MKLGESPLAHNDIQVSDHFGNVRVISQEPLLVFCSDWVDFPFLQAIDVSFSRNFFGRLACSHSDHSSDFCRA